MYRIMQDESYRQIADEILNHPRFKKLKEESHHLTCTRYDHVLTVSHYTFHLAKLFKMDVKSATRAALLHDFFYNSKKSKKDAKTLVNHPEIALTNSMKHFEINDIEANIITSHMFPLGNTTPKHKESWLVNMVDNFVSVMEYGYKFRKTAMVLMILFVKL